MDRFWAGLVSLNSRATIVAVVVVEVGIVGDWARVVEIECDYFILNLVPLWQWWLNIEVWIWSHLPVRLVSVPFFSRI